MPASGRFAAIASHRITRLTVAFAIGLLLALYAFQFATDPRTAEQRAEEEKAVRAARSILRRYAGEDGSLEIVDPLAPKRALGKAFVYPYGDGEGGGFEVSGWYRRGEGDPWHPFLMRLDAASKLVNLSVQDGDAALGRRAAVDPKLDVGEK